VSGNKIASPALIPVLFFRLMRGAAAKIPTLYFLSGVCRLLSVGLLPLSHYSKRDMGSGKRSDSLFDSFIAARHVSAFTS